MKHCKLLPLFAYLLLLAASKPVRADLLLYVTSPATRTVGEYDATTGSTINANLISGIISADGVALDNSGHLYVASTSGGNTVGEYNASTGAPINPSLISGIGPSFLAFAPSTAAVPEPSSLMLTGLVAVAISFHAWRRRPRQPRTAAV